MGASNTKPDGSGDDGDPFRLSRAYPFLLYSPPHVFSLSHAALYDRRLATLTDVPSEAFGRDPVTLEVLFGLSGSSVIEAAMNHGRGPSCLRVFLKNQCDSVVVLLAPDKSAGCCTSAASWRLTLLTTEEVITEKRLERTTHGLQFRCKRCLRHSLDCLTFQDQVELVTTLRIDNNERWMHRVAATTCRQCRGSSSRVEQRVDRPPPTADGSKKRPTVVIAMRPSKFRDTVLQALVGCGATSVSVGSEAELASHAASAQLLIVDVIFGDRGGIAAVSHIERLGRGAVPKTIFTGSTTHFGDAVRASDALYLSYDTADVPLRAMLFSALY